MLLLALTVAGIPALSPGACGGPTAPADASEVRIALEVRGGFAGQDWGYEVDGSSGVVRGLRCRGIACDWEPGEVLARVSAEQVLTLAATFVESGFLGGGREDYGAECCDQLAYVLSYADRDDRRTVRGGDATLPGEILALIRSVQEFVAEVRGDSPAAPGGAA